MALMYDPWTVGAEGGYNPEEAIMVGRKMEKLDFYCFEQPMSEDRIDS